MAAKLWLRWIGTALVAVNLCGCTMMSWDDLTSREFSVRNMWTAPPPPLVVIERSSDGYARAKALNKLEETRTPANLEKNLQVLQAAASTIAILFADWPRCELSVATKTPGRPKYCKTFIWAIPA